MRSRDLWFVVSGSCKGLPNNSRAAALFGFALLICKAAIREAPLGDEPSRTHSIPIRITNH